jgi:hypothetical protein
MLIIIVLSRLSNTNELSDLLKLYSGRCSVRISVRIPATLTEVFMGFLRRMPV